MEQNYYEVRFEQTQKEIALEGKRKAAWVDEKNKILAFHEIKNSVRIEKPEIQFWSWAMEIIKSGYRIM